MRGVGIWRAADWTASAGGVLAYTDQERNGRSDLYLLDVASGKTLNLTHTPTSIEDHAVWSPDGKLMAYQRVQNSTSQICVLLNLRRSICYSSIGLWDHSPRWSSDGRWLAFLSSDTMLFVRDLRDGSLVNYGGNDRLIFDPMWSPDGQRIVFVQAMFQTFRRTLYVSTPDLSAPQVFAHMDMQVSSPAWSPDGRQIAFVAEAGQGHAKIIAVIDTAGGEPRPLTSGGHEDSPRWSPDGSQIAYVSARDGDLDLFVINADGTDERRLDGQQRARRRAGLVAGRQKTRVRL